MIFEIVAEALGFLVVGLGPGADQLAAALEQILRSRCRRSARSLKIFGQNVPDAQQRVGGGGDAAIGIDEIRGPRVQVGGRHGGRQDFFGQAVRARAAGPTVASVCFLGLNGR